MTGSKIRQTLRRQRMFAEPSNRVHSSKPIRHSSHHDRERDRERGRLLMVIAQDADRIRNFNVNLIDRAIRLANRLAYLKT